MNRIHLAVFSLILLGVLAGGCDKPETDEISFGIDLRPVPEVTLPVGESFMIYTSYEYIMDDGHSFATLPRGFVFRATEYLPGHDGVFGWVDFTGRDGQQVSGWVDLRHTVRSRTLGEMGLQVFPLEDNAGLEIRLSQAAALQLSESLADINEDRVAEVVEQIAGPLANAATAAAAGLVTKSPLIGEITGQTAEIVVQCMVAAAKGNFAEFKQELALAAARGAVCLRLQSPAARSRFSIYPNEPEIDFSPFGSWLTPQDYGDVQYYIRLQKSALSVSPATFFDSRYWSFESTLE